MTNHEVILYTLGSALSVYDETLLSSLKETVITSSYYLNKVKRENTMVVTHEQGEF
jgi:hypothetical protein